jgi:hypothetical protein
VQVSTSSAKADDLESSNEDEEEVSDDKIVAVAAALEAVAIGDRAADGEQEDLTVTGEPEQESTCKGQ